MGLFSFIGGILGGNSQKKAADKAMQAQIDAYSHGIDVQNAQYNQTRTDYMPYTQAGVQAIGNYGTLLGNNGSDAQAAAIAALKNSPAYQSMYANGEEALLQNAAATGGLRGGNTNLALADFGRDTLASAYNTAMNGYSGLASLGLGATGSVAGFGAQNAAAAAQGYANIGNAQAGNALTKGGINAQNWNNFGSLLDSAASAFLPGGGGFSGALRSIF